MIISRKRGILVGNMVVLPVEHLQAGQKQSCMIVKSSSSPFFHASPTGKDAISLVILSFGLKLNLVFNSAKYYCKNKISMIIFRFVNQQEK